jgi:uncharacterized membrane protein YccF (DUF307 family)
VAHEADFDRGRTASDAPLGAAALGPGASGGPGGTMEDMRTLLNVVWLVLCGFWMALGYVVAGLICCVLIVTIPFGLASFRIANFALWPFGRTLVRRPGAGAASTVGNVIWFLVAGWWLALGHLVTAIGLAVTIIGLPLAWANLKLIPVSLVPLGMEIVDQDARYASRGYAIPTA